MRSSPGGWRAPLIVIGCAVIALLAVPLLAESGPPPMRGLFEEATAGPPARTGMAAAAVTAAEAVAGAGTELGVAVFDRATGEMAVGGRGAEPFYTASLAKVVVAVDVLDRRRLDGLPVDDDAVDLIRRALGPSDDDAMNALWSRFDGPGAAERVAQRAHLEHTTAPDDPSQWGEMAMAAVDMVRVWHYVLDEVPASERELLVSAMDGSPAIAADGFDQMYGLEAVSPEGAGRPGVVAKQGWMCCFGRVVYLHSAGLVGSDNRFVVALLSRMPRDPGWDVARGELSTIADAAVHALQ